MFRAVFFYSTGSPTRCLRFKILMDNRYNIPKNKKPETKAEILAERIEELVKRRDKAETLAVRTTINAEITKLFAQYERLKLS